MKQLRSYSHEYRNYYYMPICTLILILVLSSQVAKYDQFANALIILSTREPDSWYFSY